MGAVMATAWPKEESSGATAAEDRAVRRAIAAAKFARRDQWSTEMVPDLLCSISDYLPVVDFLSFRSVCRDWRSAASGRSEMLHFSRGKPWLLFYGLDDQDDDTCYFYSDSHPKCCTLRLPGLRGATCVDSMNGWILARRGRQLFFYSPFSLETVELAAECPISDSDQVYAFEGSPYCTTYVVSRREQSIVEIASYRFGEKKWHTETIDVGGESKVGSLILANTGFTVAGSVMVIYTEKSVIVYNMSRKAWECITESSEEEGEVDLFRLSAYMLDAHQDHWLFKFGKRGISISVCSLHPRSPGERCCYRGLSSNTVNIFPSGTVTVGTEEAARLKNVKAVWVDPPEDERLHVG